jgi:hypothetical protein
MHFQLLPLLLVLLLTACDGNTQKDELTLADPNSGSETDGDTMKPEEFCVD